MFVTEFHGSAGVVLAAEPAQVFALVTDVRRLTDWNTHVEQIIEDPGPRLAEGVEWVVQIHAMGTRWPSRSHVSVLDRDGLRFEYTSRTDDGNPSYVVWSWQVAAHDRGSELTVTWAGYPKTFWRRALLARVRSPRLDAEVHASLSGLGTYLVASRAVTG
jgi:hypothetical protein